MINLHYTAPYDMHDVSATRDIHVAVDCDADLHTIVESFESFIRSVGFVFPGAIEINEKNVYNKDSEDYDSWVHDSTKLNGDGCESQAAADCHRKEDRYEEWAQMLKDKKEIAKYQQETVEYLKDVQKIMEAMST